MKTFTLLLANKDCNTGKYEYFPYADKSITDFRETRRIIKELKEGKCPNNVDELSKAIFKIIDDDNLRNRIKDKGLEKSDMFSWRETANKTLEVYKELLN